MHTAVTAYSHTHQHHRSSHTAGLCISITHAVSTVLIRAALMGCAVAWAARTPPALSMSAPWLSTAASVLHAFTSLKFLCNCLCAGDSQGEIR